MNDFQTQQPTPEQNQEPTSQPEHKRPRRGFFGIGHSTKERYVTGENQSVPNALYNDTDTRIRHKREKPEHRHIIELKLQGFTNREIANLLGLSLLSVGATLKQPWARDYMITTMRKTTEDEVQELLKKEVLPSIEMLVQIRDGEVESTSVADRKDAAKYLVDRVLGKAAQPVLTGKFEPDKLTDEQLAAIAGRGLAGSSDATTTTRN